MMKNIQNEFVKMINQSIWMDPISKKRTIEKAYAIVDRIGYPGFLINDNITILEDFYKEVIHDVYRIEIIDSFSSSIYSTRHIWKMLYFYFS